MWAELNVHVWKDGHAKGSIYGNLNVIWLIYVHEQAIISGCVYNMHIRKLEHVFESIYGNKPNALRWA